MTSLRLAALLALTGLLGMAPATAATGLPQGSGAAQGSGTALGSGAAEASGTPVIVRLKPGVDAASRARGAAASGADVDHVFSAAFPGFAASIPDAELEDLSRDPAVLSVEPDAPVSLSGAQSSPPWGLDRIDQQRLPLSARYTYTDDGAGVSAYVVDTGIAAEHQDFGGRVRRGYSSVDDGRGTADCEGHGTHVAGTLAGATFGVAKAATPVAVRVLGCDGWGSLSALVAGLDWVLRDHRDGVPAVANLSLNGPPSAALDAAAQALVDDGIVVVVAAGNESVDACTTSPGRLLGVLTVGATQRDDLRADFSNFGPCLDLFAPGVGIRSAWYASTTGAVSESGTSMAAPHVAGAAAVLLSQAAPSAAEVTRRLVRLAVPGSVGDAGPGSPDRLLHVPVVPSVAAPSGSGYWMLRDDGVVASFGTSPYCGSGVVSAGPALDVEPFPDGSGYWLLGPENVETLPCRGSTEYAAPRSVRERMAPGESPVSMSATPDGSGYWVFTDRGRVVPFGSAQWFGDVSSVRLNAPVLDSVATPSGRGYYMVAADGGIFTFGDARFSGSMGGKRLNKPVMSMAPDTDGTGYWLVASDGGIFTFDARFYGSMGAVRLNRPVSGMVASPTGGGYLMVAEDGGVFTFGDVPFHGSLGSTPPPSPVRTIAVMQ